MHFIYDCDGCSERKNVRREQGIRLEITSEERHIPPLQQKQQQQHQTPPAKTIAEADGERADREIVITGTVRGDRQWEEEESSKSAASAQLLNSDGPVKSVEEGRGDTEQVRIFEMDLMRSLLLLTVSKLYHHTTSMSRVV